MFNLLVCLPCPLWNGWLDLGQTGSTVEARFVAGVLSRWCHVGPSAALLKAQVAGYSTSAGLWLIRGSWCVVLDFTIPVRLPPGGCGVHG